MRTGARRAAKGHRKILQDRGCRIRLRRAQTALTQARAATVDRGVIDAVVLDAALVTHGLQAIFVPSLIDQLLEHTPSVVVISPDHTSKALADLKAAGLDLRQLTLVCAGDDAADSPREDESALASCTADLLDEAAAALQLPSYALAVAVLCDPAAAAAARAEGKRAMHSDAVQLPGQTFQLPLAAGAKRGGVDMPWQMPRACMLWSTHALCAQGGVC